MECYNCQEVRICKQFTTCCFKQICDNCTLEITDKCFCEMTSPKLETFSEPSDDFTKMFELFKHETDKFYHFVDKTKDYAWNLETPREIWISAEALPKYTFDPPGIISRNTKGGSTVTPKGFREWFENNLDKPWNWSGLSGNPNITWEIVQAHLDKPWNWACLSKNPDITWEIVQAHLD